MLPGFPTLHRGRIDSQLRSHLPLRQAEHPARGDKAFRECVGRGQRVIPQELNDGRDVANGRNGCVAFPVRNGGFVDADLVGNLLLEEVEVETPGADVVA